MKYTSLFYFLVCLISCQQSKPKSVKVDSNSVNKKDIEWSYANIDSNLVHNPAYKELDKEKEICLSYIKGVPIGKRSSGVSYTTANKDSLDNFSRYYNCQSFLDSNNKLLINIGMGNGFVAKGFTVRYFDRQFSTKPFYFEDVIIENAPKPVYRISSQYLSLNKSTYNIGDSLYGKIDFEIFEMSGENINRKHVAHGYFRSKVKIKDWVGD